MPLPRRAAAVLAALALAGPAAAQTPIDISGITNGLFAPSGVLNGTTYPFGAQTLGGIPFLIDQGAQPGGPTQARGWFAHTAAGGGGGNVSVSVPVGVFGVTDVYTLINTFWGATGGPYASLTFNGSLGATHTVNLFGNVDIRDYNQFAYTNSINGTTTVEVFNNGTGQRLDRQHIALPAAFAGQTLTDVVLLDAGAPGFQRTFLAGVTVVAPTAAPEPATLALVTGGLAALGVVARRRARRA